ncbi:MAG: nucleotide exchange factor GrpE [Desmonostoc geniculatum HA4340-LM1]|jgi:molecular chaperone GrpE|nr:nucleotide exchange factor GrpE [Desmonostoc geniculatum HA4340-LM1]
MERSLLEILCQKRVVPIIAEGKLFGSQIMYAVGREVKTDVAENTLIQEVVKGYLWGDKINLLVYELSREVIIQWIKH